MSTQTSASTVESSPRLTPWKLFRLRMVSIWYRVSVGKRLLMLGLMSAAVIAFPSAIYLNEANRAIATSRNELAGVPVIRALYPVMKAFQAHRGLSNGLLNGNKALEPAQRAAAEKADKALADAQARVTESGKADSVGTPLKAMTSEWNSVRSGVSGGSIDAPSSFKAHTKLVGQVADLIMRAGDEYEQTLDPEVSSLHLVLVVVMNMPPVIEYVADLRGTGTGILAAKSISEDQRRQMLVKIFAARSVLHRSNYSLDRALSAMDADGNRVAAAYAESTNAVVAALSRAEQLANAATIEGAPDEFFKTMSVAVDAQYALADLAQEALANLVRVREQQQVSMRNILIAGVLSVGLIYAFIATLISLSISGPFKSALEVCENIANGFIGQNIGVRGTDEMARLRMTMRDLQEALTRFIAEINLLSQRQAEGILSHRMDASAFAGAFKEAALRLNKLVDEQNAEMLENFSHVGHYAAGDFSEDVKPLPGEKRVISDNVSQVKASLSAVSVEIQALVDAASRGEFHKRGDASGYKFEFRKMVEGLNQLMQAADTGLSEVGATLQRMAQADLSQKMTGNFQGKFAELQTDANKTIEQLVSIMTGIREASDTINVGSKEIAEGNTDLSSRTEEQASSLEETASSMEELTSTVKQNAENARQANQLAVEASAVAAKGGGAFKQVVSTMSSINDSSKKIVDIISVIDGIAFQTNILALNAAVEAARAGEQGRGFAVVATEVRNLAQRSAAAAKEITDLIGDSVEKVGAGTKLVDDAGKTMDEIVSSVKRVTDIMAEITAASMEQSTGIEQVNQAITQMDEVTQQNAALVEQAAAAAESMEEQAGNLANAVAIFRLTRQTSAMGKSFDFDSATQAHLNWKHKLIDYLAGKGEKLRAAEVARDNCCPLGIWLYGPGKQYADSSEYRSLKNDHAKFHQFAGEVIDLADDGQIDAARAELNGEFETTSKATIGRIYAMRAVADRVRKSA